MSGEFSVGVRLCHRSPTNCSSRTGRKTRGWLARSSATRKDAGAETFLDHADIKTGDDWVDVIEKAADESAELLVLLTPEVLKSSKYVWVEVGYFRGKRIVWVLYKVTSEQIRADDRVAGIIQRSDTIQINDLDNYFAELRTRIAAARGGT
jgi:hypothetical protein